jgi:hypothetical protein
VGRTGDSEVTSGELQRMADDLRDLAGATEAQIEAALAQHRAAAQPAVFRVHPANVTAVRLFQGMQTQWNMIVASSLGGALLLQTGLKYEALDRVARGLGIEEGPDDFRRLQLMEAEALLAWSEARR